MSRIERETRERITDNIERLLRDNCRQCEQHKSHAHWGNVCRGCPVLAELQTHGEELGFTNERIPAERAPIDPALEALAMANGIPRRVYNYRVQMGKDPVEAANVPVMTVRRPDAVFLDLAISRGIPRTTYTNRRKSGWTPEEAANYKQGATLRRIREGRANDLYIV